MHLTPRELDKLVLLIRDGRSVAELMDAGRRLLGQRQVMDGVTGLIAEVQVEGTFPDGTKLVTVHDPIVLEDGDLALALYGSFLPVPSLELVGAPAVAVAPGAPEVSEAPIEINAARRTIVLDVVHIGDRPIQVGSHHPLADVNLALEFDREAATRMRLDVPAGTAVRSSRARRARCSSWSWRGRPLLGAWSEAR